jgi:uncharacterized membrane protein YraQ (UPF0718 family)
MKTGFIFLFLVIVAYGTLYFLGSSHVLSALQESWKVLKSLLFIFLIMFIILFLIEMFLDDKKIAKYLGVESGAKAWLIALLGGIFSMGSSYVWYPMLQSLREKGVRDSLIITFLYSRSIKLPWIPLMVVYFGSGFTIVMMLYIAIGSLIQGFIIDKITKEKAL